MTYLSGLLKDHNEIKFCDNLKRKIVFIQESSNHIETLYFVKLMFDRKNYIIQSEYLNVIQIT